MMNNEDVLINGLAHSFNNDRFYVEKDVMIYGDSNTATVQPVSNPLFDMIISQCSSCILVIRTVSQSDWNNLLRSQLTIQIIIMIIELITSLISVVMSYLPIRRFLISFEKVFIVTSVSEEKLERMKEKTIKMFESGQMSQIAKGGR